MKTTRLARRLGLDGNPLRRRIDKIAACLAALLVAVLLIGAPILSIAAARWAGHATVAGQRAARFWRQVPAVLLHAVSQPAGGGGSATPGPQPGGPHRTDISGLAGSSSVPARPRAARSACGWTRRAHQLVLRPATLRRWPARP